MRALSIAERDRYDVLRPRVLAAVEQVQEMPTDFHLRISRSSVTISDVAEWMEMEVHNTGERAESQCGPSPSA